MPIYDYKCSNCEHQIEVIQKISDDPKTTCPKCNKESLSKLISAPSFRLKGSGWYETDFKTGKNRNEALGSRQEHALKAVVDSMSNSCALLGNKS